MNAEEDEVLTAEELAELMLLDRKTIYAAIKRGQIPGVRRIGRAIRISARTVRAWLNEGEATSGGKR